MRPEAVTAPARILVTRGVVFDTSQDDLGTPREQTVIPLALDLAAVVAVRGYVADKQEGGQPDPGRCIAEFAGDDGYTVLAPFEEVLAAWLAYRAHADALGRIRN